MAYSESQNKATQRYKAKSYKRVPLDVPNEFYVYLKGVAEEQGRSVNGFIKEAINEKCSGAKDELPQELLPNLMKWLKEHGHSESEIVDCIEHLAD